MKVSCQSCSAQYNLPDDKVRGRKAKVRCKKCGASIVVDGTAQSSSTPPDQSFDDEDEATRIIDSPLGRPSVLWTVNLSDEDQREMTTEEVVSGWLAKEVTDDAYVWRDGMEEWLPILSAPELVQAVRAADPSFRSEPPAAAAPAAERRPPPPAASSGVDLSPPAPKVAPRAEVKAAAPVAAKPLAAASPAKPKPQPTSPVAASTGGLGGGLGTASASAAAKRPMVTAGLFGQIPEKGKPTASKQAARTAAAGGDMFGSTRAPSQHPPKPAENSVMFSLDALKAAAAVDNSGAEQDTRVSEDLLVMGGPTGYDLNPAPLIQIDMPPPAPVMMAAAPVSLAGAASAQAAQKSGSFSTAVMAVAGLVIVAGAFFGVRSLTAGKTSTPPADSAPVSAGAERKAVEVPAEPGAADGKPADSPAAAEPSAAEPAAVKPGAANAPAGGQVAVTPKPPVVGGASPGPKKEPSGPVKAPPPKAPVEAASKAGFNVSAAKDALGAAASQAKLCKSGDGPTGSGKVQVTFAPSGRVTNASVSGPPFAGTSVGGCVARAFRGARVPAFDGAPQTVSKGFSIN